MNQEVQEDYQEAISLNNFQPTDLCADESCFETKRFARSNLSILNVLRTLSRVVVFKYEIGKMNSNGIDDKISKTKYYVLLQT